MPARIPQQVREEVIQLWLGGVSRDQIALTCAIGTGTVSRIIMEYRAVDLFLDLQRELALELKTKNLSIQSFASSIRLNRLLTNLHLPEDKLEAFIQNVDVYCFKDELSHEVFIDRVNEACNFASERGVPIGELAQSITGAKRELEGLRNETQVAVERKAEAIRDADITLDAICDYQRERPTIENYQKIKAELEKKTKELDHVKLRLEALDQKVDAMEARQFLRDLTNSVEECELERLGHIVGREITYNEFCETIRDIKTSPTKYGHMFKQMLQRQQYRQLDQNSR